MVDDEKPSKIQGGSIALESSRTFVTLVQALVWPCLLIYLFIALRDPVTGVLNRANKVEAKFAGFEVSLTAVAASAANATAAAIKQNIDPRVAAQNIAQSFPSGQVQARPLTEGRVLWVDDKPQNNILLSNAFQDLGIRIFFAASTQQAQMLIQQTKFDVVISDATRSDNNQEGETLVRWIRRQADPPPTIIYAAEWAVRNRARAGEIGALSITNDPSELYHLVLRIIQRLAPYTASFSADPTDAGISERATSNAGSGIGGSTGAVP